MKYYIFTLGCQMNISDSERIATKLEALGYIPAPEYEAGLVIVNACSVRQKAVDRIWGKIKLWQNKNKKILITGCFLKNDQQKFIKKNIRFLKITDLPQINKFLSKNSNTSQYGSFDSNYFHIKPKFSGKTAYVPIMTGCDNFCSYCAVPYTRGREKSRPAEDVISDVKTALKNCSKNILLLGQNVNSYGLIKNKRGRTKIDNDDFIKLLKTIDDITSDFSFNFMSSNPHDMSEELIECYAGLKKWPRELHLAMQSGDNEILRKMNRKYNSKQYLSLIKNLKLKIENLSVTTDIIVGFPEETNKQFENTVKMCKKIGFEKAYISQYSPRPGTTSSKLDDNVTKDEKKRRWLILDKLINHSI